MRPPFTELPFGDTAIDAEVHRLMAERNETLDDIMWIVGGSMRAADFTYAIMRTKQHVYTIVSDFWDDDAYVPRVFVAPLLDKDGRPIRAFIP
jgi:hypothetical protein